jgi:hypothetical protein
MPTVLTFLVLFLLQWTGLPILSDAGGGCGAYTVKKVSGFPVPSRDATYKLSLAGNNLGDGKTANLFLLCKSGKNDHVLLSILLFYVGNNQTPY